MSLWDNFCKSGKISDYLDYAKFEKEGAGDDNLKRIDFAGTGRG